MTRTRAGWRHPGIVKVWATAITIAAAGLGSCGAAAALECPESHARATSNALKETPQEIRSFSRLLAAQGEDAVPDILSSLRTDDPHASNAEKTNFVITLYCPVIQKNDALSEHEKRQRLERISARLMTELSK